MKKIIKGKRYDTESAKAVGVWSYGSWSNFNHVEETLYRKNTGEFFLHGEGGANTTYAERVDANTWCGGEQIMPLTFSEAQEWAEKHLDADEYENIFGEVVEDDSRKVVSYSLPRDVVELIKRGAVAAELTQSEYIARLVRGENRGEN